MFSGIVEGTRLVTAITQRPDGLEFEIDLQDTAHDLAIGDSVAINGVCLTVIKQQGGKVSFHAMPETLRKTTMGELKVGDTVDVERSLRVGQTIDGHFVQGHIFATLPVTKRVESEKEFILWFDAGQLAKYVAPLGSVAINGVSLTVAEKDGSEFSVSLIPITLERTNLRDLREGDLVNFEPDIIARQIVHFLENQTVAQAH